MSCISVRSQFSKLIYSGDVGISQTFEHYNHQNLTVALCAVLWFTCLEAPGRVKVFDLWRCDYKHKKNCLQVT